MASERIELLPAGNHMELSVWFPSPEHGTHVTLPLDANALDAEAVEAAARAIYAVEPDPNQSMLNDPAGTANSTMLRMARAAIAAYAHHVAGGVR